MIHRSVAVDEAAAGPLGREWPRAHASSVSELARVSLLATEEWCDSNLAPRGGCCGHVDCVGGGCGESAAVGRVHTRVPVSSSCAAHVWCVCEGRACERVRDVCV